MESGYSSSEIILFAGTSVLIMVALALVMVSYANWAQRRILAQRMAAQEAEIRHQQELVQRNLGTQEEERKRIAANLHDDIGAKLGVLHLTLHRLRRAVPMTAEQGAMFDEIDGLIATTMDSARRISHELMPPTLEDFGLIAALEEFCEGIRRTGAVEISLEYNIERNDLGDPAIELNLFRIVQELSNNTLKYAQASKVDINLLKSEEGIVTLRYHDNGRGFNPADEQGKGLGMKNLENRAKIIGGNWKIKTAPGQGFEATVRLGGMRDEG
jgi:signal transduction histidine kinase